MYDPATGRSLEGIESDRPRGKAQRINVNSCAESTIHGLLVMLQLDARPDVAAQAMVAQRVANVNWSYVKAEAGTLSGNARVVTPPDGAWTGGSTRTTFGGYDLGVSDHRKAGDQGITPLPGYQDVVSVGIAGPVIAGGHGDLEQLPP